MLAIDRKMWRDLFALRAQTVTTAILIICGVALLVSTWSAYQSLRSARDSYYQEYSFADLFADFKRAPSDVLARVKRIPGVQQLVPRVSAEGLVNILGKSEPAVGRFLSLPSGEQPPLNRLHLRLGRLPIDGNELEVVAHEGFAKANHLKPGDQIQVLIEGQEEEARIVGIGLSPEFIYALSPAAPLPDDLHFGVFWMTETRLQRMMRMKDAFNSFTAQLSPNASKPDIISAVDQILKPYGSLGAYGRDRQVSNMFVDDEIAQQKVSAIFNPAVFLGIAAFLVNIVASRLITTHRSQIAALKAIGYTKWEVSFHYLKLILLMTLVGTFPGIALGAALGRWMSKTYESYYHFPQLHFSISAMAAVVGLFAGILPGLVGAWASIRSTFRLAPAEAMRPLAPPSFHATLFERLKLHERLPARYRMVVRNLLLRPYRLALLIFSLSAALAIVISAGSWSDMMEFLLQTQFNRLQREDLSINLIRPRPTNAMQEIAKIPGVIAAEGYRVVPVRIKFQNYKRELALTGWPEKSEMRGRLDRRLRSIPLPAEGLLLSQFFHKSWGMKAGDLVEVHPLEGTQKTFSLPVTGFTDDLIGISASMNIRSLWSLMDEEPDYNEVTIRADPLKIGELYIRLKSRPEIATVNLKQALYQGFRSSFGEVMRTSTMVLMVASLLIAVGIIYNSVRVSFSERSWELASLRVLGFERSRVAEVLLVEVGTQVALSLAPGCVYGWALTELSMKLIHTETFGFPVIIELATYARGILTILLAFAGSAWIVQRMIDRLSPAEALKSRD